MHQSIVLSPTIFLSLQADPRNTLRLITNLLTERLVVDNDRVLLLEYKDVVSDQVQGHSNQSVLQNLIPFLTSQCGYDPVTNIQINRRTPAQFEFLESEIGLACQRREAPLVASTQDKDTKASIIRNHIELACVDEYLNPGATSMIRAEEHLRLEVGDKFDLRRWLKKYTRDATSLLIEDPYLCEEFQFSDLEFILKTVPMGIPITLITTDDTTYLGGNAASENQIKLRQLSVNSGQTNCQIKLKRSTHINERTLETNHFIINLGHALGCIRNETHEVRRQAIIDVTSK